MSRGSQVGRQRDDRGQRGLERRAGGEHRAVGGLDALLDLAEAHPEQDAVVVRRVGAPARACPRRRAACRASGRAPCRRRRRRRRGGRPRCGQAPGPARAEPSLSRHSTTSRPATVRSRVRSAGTSAEAAATSQPCVGRRRAAAQGGLDAGRTWPRARCRAGGRGSSGAGSAPARGGAPPHARTGRCAAGSRGNANPARRPGPDPSTTTTTTPAGASAGAGSGPGRGASVEQLVGPGRHGVVDDVAVGGQHAQAERGAPGVVGGRQGGQSLAHRGAVAQPAVQGEQLGGGAVGGDRDEAGVGAGREGQQGVRVGGRAPRPGARGRSRRPRRPRRPAGWCAPGRRRG